MRGKRMAELGPPFGGITRIRFKGFVYDVSAIRLPRTNFFKLRPAAAMSKVDRPLRGRCQKY
jgi:hypothetical protein